LAGPGNTDPKVGGVVFLNLYPRLNLIQTFDCE
jgi:hypothetical protein